MAALVLVRHLTLADLVRSGDPAVFVVTSCVLSSVPTLVGLYVLGPVRENRQAIAASTSTQVWRRIAHVSSCDRASSGMSAPMSDPSYCVRQSRPLLETPTRGSTQWHTLSGLMERAVTQPNSEVIRTPTLSL